VERHADWIGRLDSALDAGVGQAALGIYERAVFSRSEQLKQEIRLRGGQMKGMRRRFADALAGLPSPVVGAGILTAVLVLLVGLLLVLDLFDFPQISRTLLLTTRVELGALLTIVCGAIIAAGVRVLRKRRQGATNHDEKR
jgi:hypothetical protein